MPKFYGSIGYAELVETSKGVWDEKIVTKNYPGDWVRNTRRLQESGGVNDNINISNRLSIVADPYANKNFHMMRYVSYMNVKWKVLDVEVLYPRLILTLGGLYNEQTIGIT